MTLADVKLKILKTYCMHEVNAAKIICPDSLNSSNYWENMTETDEIMIDRLRRSIFFSILNTF